MNIFILDKNPLQAPWYLISKHKSKMVLETAQILCSPFPSGYAPYLRTHYNHPCCLWARTSLENYRWLLRYGKAIGYEYHALRGRWHKSSAVIEWCFDHVDRLSRFGIRSIGLTPFAQAMPSQYRIEGNPVLAYRNYYRAEKLQLKYPDEELHPIWL